MKCNLFFLLIVWIFNCDVHAQDQAVADSIPPAQDKSQSVFSVLFKGNPGKALAYSLILPGAGQVYNKRIWKVPIIYAGLGSMVYFISFNKKELKRYDDAIRERVDNPQNPQDEFVGILSNSGIDSYRKFYDKNLQLSYIGLVAIYLLNGIEAFVDRHLQEYDISDNLSLQLNPDPLNKTAVVTVYYRIR